MALNFNQRKKMSLLQLPQNIWREKIVFFLKNVEELVRLDTAVMNKSDRADFLSNISGCKRFAHYDNQGGVGWFVLRNIIVGSATISSQLQHDDSRHLDQLLAQVTYIEFKKGSLHEDKFFSLRTDWLRSNALTDLTISDCEIEDISALSVCTNLVFLELSNCANASTESFTVGIKGCIKLYLISICNCARLRETAVVAVLQACVQLSNVQLNGRFDLTQVFSEITKPTSVTSLFCTDEQTILSGSVLRIIATFMPQIRSLDLRYTCNTIVDGDIEALGQSCTQLTGMHMHHCTRITNAVFSQITQCLSRLQNIFIDYCWSVTDAGVIALAHSATNLRTLRLTNQNVTDAAIRAVGTHCRLLSSLDVTKCLFLTDDAFSTLNMTQLWFLDVSGTRVTGTFAKHVFSESSALRRLSALHCDFLAADFVHSLPVRYVNSLSLRLASLNRLTESDWLLLSTKLPNLHTLHVSDTAAVNDAVARSFKTNCLKLRNVDLKGCSVSEDVLKLFC